MIEHAKVLSLFDGMACGMLAMQSAGIKVDRYVAFEIEKYAVQTSSHNFPMIEHRGDVFKADFTEFRGFDFLVGGSPCTYWSIAQKNNRETEASGMGWELFSQYVRALREAQPMYFIYENNKSMSKAIRKSITETFGFEPVLINSALVSAQNRQRLYWVGRRNTDGTYSQVHVEQPEDRGILLKDVLDGVGAKDLTEREMDYMVRQTSGVRNHFDFGYIQDATRDKGACLTANVSKGVPYNVCCEPVRIPEYGDRDKARPLNALYPNNCGGWEHRVFNENPHKQQVDLIAVPVGNTYELDAESVATYASKDGSRVGTIVSADKNKGHDSQQNRVYTTEGKSVALCGNGGGKGAITGLYAIPCCKMPVKEATKVGFTEIEPFGCVDLEQAKSKTRRGRNMAEKANCLITSCQYYQYCGVLGLATPCEWDEDGNVVKAVSVADGKIHPVYQVKDGMITIKGKKYPIKLVDGVYIIRKLTVSECKRLQTVPEWYEFPVSDSQAYKMLGNGWTVEVIAHLIRATQADAPTWEQMRIFEQ